MICCLAWVHGSEIEDESPLAGGESPDAALSKAAKKADFLKSLQWRTSTGDYAFFYNITDGDNVLAYLNLTKAPIRLDLVKVGDGGALMRDSRNDVQIFGTSLLTVVPTITASNTTVANNQRLISAKLAFKDIPEQDPAFSVKTADLEISIQIGGPTRTDYWNMTSIKLALSFSVNGSNPESLSVDLTPRFGFTTRMGDTACESGYGICAPLATMWTCRDQRLQQVNLKSAEKGAYTVVSHFYGMQLQPNLGTKPFSWGYFWDCDPVIPLPVWVALIISLGMAFVVWWALFMLNGIHPPTKFDDPKGPSIHIPQTD